MKYYCLIIVSLIVDQVSKILVRTNMAEGESIQIIGDFFQLHYIENRGAAFSMLQGQTALLIILPVIVSAFALWYLEKKRKTAHFTLPLAVSLIVAGGIGNLIDRVLFASVTDMISFSIFPPIFNIADIAVCVGAGFLVLNVLFFDKEKSE